MISSRMSFPRTLLLGFLKGIGQGLLLAIVAFLVIELLYLST